MATDRLLFKTIYDLYGNEIEVGSRVIIVGQGSYKQCLIGKTGEVRSVYAGNVGVLLDGTRNERSGYGRFYFDGHQLKVLDDNDDITEDMEDKNMSAITNYVNIAKIQYIDNTKPSVHSYANFDTGLAVGDLCVIQSASHGIGLAKVTEIIDENDVALTREVVAKVDLDYFNERVKVRNQAAQLKAKMEERAKQLQDIALYQMLANDDPDMMKLLKEYQSLPKV